MLLVVLLLSSPALNTQTPASGDSVPKLIQDIERATTESAPPPNLPIVRKVSLELKDVVAPEAIRRFWQAAGVPVACAQGKGSMWLDQERKITVSLRNVPLWEAATKFCDAYGDMHFRVGHRMGIIFYPFESALTPAQTWTQGIFAYSLGGVEEEVFTDFQTVQRACTVELHVFWQGDLRVLRDGPLSVTHAVDNEGRDFLKGVTVFNELKSWNKNDQATLYRKVRLPIAPPGANSMTLKGNLELEIPKKATPVRLHVGRGAVSKTFEEFLIQGKLQSTQDENVVMLTIRPQGGTLEDSQILDLAVWGELDSWSLWFPWYWTKPDSLTKSQDGSMKLLLRLKKDRPASISFTIAQGRRRISVPFTLDSIPLPR